MFKASDLMQPTLHRRAFTRAGWIFESKVDGFRCLIIKGRGKVSLISRQGKPLTATFPELVAGLARLENHSVLDAELVVPDEAGKPSFERTLQRSRMSDPDAIAVAARTLPASLVVFDVMTAYGADVRESPLMARKEQLADLLPVSTAIQLASYTAEHGEAAYALAIQHGGEGIVGKDATSTYRAGRQATWLKIKNPDFYRKEALGIRG